MLFFLRRIYLSLRSQYNCPMAFPHRLVWATLSAALAFEVGMGVYELNSVQEHAEAFVKCVYALIHAFSLLIYMLILDGDTRWVWGLVSALSSAAATANS